MVEWELLERGSRRVMEALVLIDSIDLAVGLAGVATGLLVTYGVNVWRSAETCRALTSIGCRDVGHRAWSTEGCLGDRRVRIEWLSVWAIATLSVTIAIGIEALVIGVTNAVPGMLLVISCVPSLFIGFVTLEPPARLGVVVVSSGGSETIFRIVTTAGADRLTAEVADVLGVRRVDAQV